MKLKEMLTEGKYYKNDTEFGDNNNDKVVWSITGHVKEEDKVYTYDEAINLTGNGWYNISLLMVLSLAVQAMALDMFGFSYVVTAATCDLELTHNQTSFLLSVPLMGSIIAAYFHGYISDVHGRKKCLGFALWGSFVIACLSSLSPNFIVLAVLKFFACSISSGVQSMAYTLMGESSSVSTKEGYVVIMTSALMCAFAVFTAHAYIVLGFNFTIDLGFIIFKPWRLLILTLAAALGSSAVFLTFFYESPKFLVSIGRTEEAVNILQKIKIRNRKNNIYPVKKIILLEGSSTQRNEVSFLRSLWNQIAPLFKPPLLQKTLLLFYIIAVIYSINNGFFIWFPLIFDTIFKETSSPSKNVTDNFCNLINFEDSQEKNKDCVAVVSVETLAIAFIQGLVFVTINCGAAKFAHKKKIAVIFFSFLSTACCFSLLFITKKIITVVFFIGVLLNAMVMGLSFCYIIELFPTRYRGMMTALGVMIARLSALIGVNLIGTYMFTYCTISLYGWGAYTLSGVLMAFLLPPDVDKKS